MDGETTQDWGHIYVLMEDSENPDLDLDFQPQLQSMPQEHTENMWTEVNRHSSTFYACKRSNQ